MIQKLLTDRVQLKFHREKRDSNVYVLTVGKTGIKFSKSVDPNGPSGRFFGPPPMTLRVTNATMGDVASVIQTGVLDKPVVDQTGLTEKYDFMLKFTPEQGQMLGLGGAPPPQPDNADAPPDIFTAMQQQLGLKLESTKAPADVIVIDHIERPSEN